MFWIFRQTGPNAPKALSELTCLRDYLASPTPPKKSSKNAIVYSERMLEMEQARRKCRLFRLLSFAVLGVYHGGY